MEDVEISYLFVLFCPVDLSPINAEFFCENIGSFVGQAVDHRIGSFAGESDLLPGPVKVAVVEKLPEPSYGCPLASLHQGFDLVAVDKAVVVRQFDDGGVSGLDDHS